ncbi:MAG: hypothetical protein JNM07_04195 [Phycisphaerae bacterium]|nr:hypothetical protein [Phycisphaerae bacterium]
MAVCAAAEGQPSPSRDVVHNWFEAEWAAAQALPDLGDCSLRWRMEFAFAPTDDELLRMRASVEGKPDHPDRGTLRSWTLAHEGTPEFIRVHLWCRGNGRWRYCSDPSAIPDGYRDEVRTPATAWTLSKPQLTVLVPPDPDRDGVPASERVFGPELRRFLLGGMYCETFMRLPNRTLAVSGLGWTVRALSREVDGEPLFGLMYEGRWDAGAERGFVERVRITHQRGQRQAVGESYVYDDWRYNEALGRWLCHTVSKLRPDGRLDRRWLLEDVQPGAAGTFERVTAMPSADRPDALRGALDGRTLVRQDGSGNADGNPPNRADTGSLVPARRWLGWGLAGAVMAFISIVAAVRFRGVRRVHSQGTT